MAGVEYQNEIQPIVKLSEKGLYTKIETYQDEEGNIHRDNDLPAEIYYSNDVILKLKWYHHGKLHREGDLPAVIRHTYGEINNTRTRKWYKHGIICRADLNGIHRPAYVRNITSIHSGKSKICKWYIDGKLGRLDDLPASVRYYEDGSIRESYWYINGIKSRLDDKPTSESFYENGKIYHRKWRVNGLKHRDNDLPALLIYDKIDGSIIESRWYINGKKSRLNDKPARIIVYENGNILYIWLVNGKVAKRNNGKYNGKLKNANNKTIEHYWYKKEFVLHSPIISPPLGEEGEKGPAAIKYYTNGNVSSYRWIFKNRLHRTNNKPAYISLYKDGSVKEEKYYKKGNLLKTDDGKRKIYKYNKGEKFM